MKRITTIIFTIIIAGACGVWLIVKFSNAPRNFGNATNTIHIVAAENFYGDIAAQIAGNKASVTSIISNPNVDPHEYDATVQDGIAVAQADIVIENGLGYDTWMEKLISASPAVARAVIVAGTTPGVTELSDNPHVWYGADNMAAIARAIEAALAAKDPADAAAFADNLNSFTSSLEALRAKMSAIKSSYAGTPVALTETIYLYPVQTMGLDVLTPFGFEKAVAEGNDPSAQDVSAANAQIADRQAKVFIYNSQTVTPITTNLENAAQANGIPVVAVTETMPPGDTYQSWMAGELDALSAALAQSAGH